MRPWRPPFHASSAARKGPISSKRVSSQDPLLRKFGNFNLNSLNFHPNFSSQAPKFGNFQLTSPQIWKFSAQKPPNLKIFRSQPPPFQRQMSARKPHTSEIRAAHPYLKKSWVPPGGTPPWAPTGVKVPWSLKCYGMSTYFMTFSRVLSHHCLRILVWFTCQTLLGKNGMKSTVEI